MRSAVLVIAVAATLPVAANDALALVEVDAQCRYDPASRRWVRETVERSTNITDFSDRVGLFWIRWRDDGRSFTKMVVSGPVKCNDLMIGPPPRPDLIPACVPSATSAKADHVPDPAVHCR